MLFYDTVCMVFHIVMTILKTHSVAVLNFTQTSTENNTFHTFHAIAKGVTESVGF